MGFSVPPSSAVAELLRTRRAALGLTLREVQEQARSLGDSIPITVIARAERGEIDPGFRRLNLLLRVYQLPVHVAGDLADLEQYAGEVQPDPGATSSEAAAQWKAGDLRNAMASLLSVKTPIDSAPSQRLERQKSLLSFAVAAAGLGKYRLSRHIVDELLLEPPEPPILPRLLAHAATCWHRLGSAEVALALLDRAEVHIGPEDHQNRAWISHNRAATLVTLGEYAAAETQLTRALDAYRACGDAHGEGRALGVLVRLHRDRGDLVAALDAARQAQEYARSQGHERNRIMRRIDEGRILIGLKDTDAGIAALHDALSGAVAMQDQVCQFHAHYYLWEAFRQLGDLSRADLELRVAQYFVRYLDETTPEAVRIRETLGGSARSAASSEPDSSSSTSPARGRGRKPPVN